jgi:hypothetical protein
MKYTKRHARWINTITATQPITPVPQVGVVYWGDTGNANMVVGILLSYEDDGWTIIRDARDKEHRVIQSTLRSAQ